MNYKYGIDNSYGHRELNSTACLGDYAMPYVDFLKDFKPYCGGMMNNKIVSVCLFIFLFTLMACANISLSAVTPTAMISSTTPTNTQSNVSTPYDPSIQAPLDFISEERETGMQQGNEMVVAIEKYYKETSRYPENLNELVPVYLNEIPLTITEEQFEYRLVEPQLYYLSFLLRRRAERFACTYMGDLKTWECSGTGH